MIFIHYGSLSSRHEPFITSNSKISSVRTLHSIKMQHDLKLDKSKGQIETEMHLALKALTCRIAFVWQNAFIYGLWLLFYISFNMSCPKEFIELYLTFVCTELNQQKLG